MAGARPIASEDRAPAAQRPRRRRHRVRIVLLCFLAAWMAVGVWQTNKPLPPGVDVTSPWYDVAPNDVRLLTDTTVTDGHGRLVIRQEIFDEVLRVVDSAQQFV